MLHWVKGMSTEAFTESMVVFVFLAILPETNCVSLECHVLIPWHSWKGHHYRGMRWDMRAVLEPLISTITRRSTCHAHRRWEMHARWHTHTYKIAQAITIYHFTRYCSSHFATLFQCVSFLWGHYLKQLPFWWILSAAFAGKRRRRIRFSPCTKASPL